MTSEDESKTPASGPMLSRFQGEAGRKLLLEVLSEESVIRGADGFEAFIDQCKLLEVESGTELISQSGSDNDLYIILSGSFSIHINGRLQTTRRVGQHVGEIALIDPTARRTGSVVAGAQSYSEMPLRAFFKTCRCKPQDLAPNVCRAESETHGEKPPH